MASHPPSHLSTAHAPSQSPSTLRAPSSFSPIASRRDPAAEPSRGWTSSGASNVPRRTPNGYVSSEPEGGSGRDSPELPRIATALGAEGGSAAINARRRQSSSFKTLSTGSLVSKSPFRQGAAAAGPPPPLPTSAAATNSIYGVSRLPQSTRIGGPSGSPTVERRVSGSRKVSGEVEVVKENLRESEAEAPAKHENSAGTTDSTFTKPPSSPSIPFRPVRSHAASPSISRDSGFPPPSSGASFRPTRPQSALQGSSNMDDPPRRQSSSYAAVRKNGLVSSSPFMSRGVPTVPGSLEHPSPPLHETPSPSLPSDSPSFDPEPAEEHKINGPMGLGIRPGGAPLPERHFAGASAPPPSTPPHEHQRSNSYSSSPSSALSPSRRWMMGPRPLEEDEITSEDLGRTLRRQPSSKTVTWAATEEVLEFEVDDEERRRSGASERSESSSIGDSEDGEEWRDGENSLEEEGDRSLGFEVDDANESLGYEEGGSVEMHHFGDESEDDHEGSAVSTASSTVEDMMGEIDAFMGDVFSPSLVTDDDAVFGRTNGDLDLASLSKNLPQLPLAASSPAATKQGSSGPQSAFSISSTGAQSDSDSDNDDVNSESSYTDEEEVVLQAARAKRISEAMMEAERAAPLWIPTPAPHLAPSTSAYSLPDLPEGSPFLGFEDTGTSSSVVTFDLGDEPPSSVGATVAPVQPLFTQVHAIPLQSTPTKNVPLPAPNALEVSPILSAFADASPPPLHLSRHASIVDFELSTLSSGASKFANMRGSLRGASKLREGRDRLDEKLRQHQAILSTPSESTNSDSTDDFVPRNLDLFPHPPPKASPPLQSPPPSQAPRIVETPKEQVRAIQARPALKVTEATVSTTMLPTIAGGPKGTRVEVGARLTAQVVDEMESPLDRLRKEVGGDEWKEGDSIESFLEDLPTLPGGSGLLRRRSLSTGDIASKATLDKRAAALPHHINVSEEAFSRAGLDESIDHVFSNRDRAYRVRETKKVVYANDFDRRIMTSGTAGDVDPGSAWRKKRPSDVHGMTSTLADFKRMSEVERLSGQVFVTLGQVQFSDLPTLSRGTTFTCLLSDGRDQVKAGEFDLVPVVRLRKEFELTGSATLNFSIGFQVPVSTTVNSHLLPLPAPASLPPLPPSPTKSPHRLRNVFSSPKKKAPVPIARPPPPPERITQYLAPDGTLAKIQVNFAAKAAECRAKTVRLIIPFESNGGASTSARGTTTVELFHLPSIPGIKRDALPKSVDEVKRGLEAADYHSKILIQGVLTQMGGDCLSWKRRNFKLRGSVLIPYSEVTKKAYVEIDLANAVAIEDSNAPLLPSTAPTLTRSSSMDMDDDPWRMDRSFKLVFKDGAELRFFADSDKDKAGWLRVLGAYLDAPPKGRKAPPAWAVVLRKLQTA